MSGDLIVELWQELKPHINPKERVVAADRLVSILDDFGYSDGIEFEVGLDPELQAAVSERFELELEDDEDDRDW